MEGGPFVCGPTSTSILISITGLGSRFFGRG